MESNVRWLQDAAWWFDSCRLRTCKNSVITMHDTVDETHREHRQGLLGKTAREYSPELGLVACPQVLRGFLIQ